jgi:lysophospholipase L1-like esterase
MIIKFTAVIFTFLLILVVIKTQPLMIIDLSEKILGVSSKPTKSSYSIAVYGDSMVDTMGEQLEYLQKSLKKRYPNTTFYYYNYGIGSQNVDQGLARFHSPFKNKTRSFVPLSELKPDIIIIGSFAYNPYAVHNRDQHWRNLNSLVNEAKATGADVYMLAEVAPLRENFGKGPNGVNWPPSLANQQAERIVAQLENAVFLALDHQKISLINVYQTTKVNGKFGDKRWVDSNDGIHPSVAGHTLMAEMIASKIKLP